MPDDGDEADATPTPPPATPSTTPTATKWTDGNFTIISSDNHVFRIADYHLLSASSVFRGMLSAGSGALRIELTDPAMEDSGTLNRALDFIVNAVFDSNDIKHMVAVGLFLKKYDCAASAKQFVLFIKQVPCAPRVKTFILGASLDDEELCATTLQHPLPQWEKGVRGANISLDAHTVPNSGCQFNSNGWTISWTAATPLRYKWALDRAWRHHEDSAELAPAFRKYLGRAKASQL